MDAVKDIHKEMLPISSRINNFFVFFTLGDGNPLWILDLCR
jgi:hypothetical protein